MPTTTQVTPLGPGTPSLPSLSLKFEKSWIHLVVSYASFLLGIGIVLLVSVDTIVNNWSINDFVGDGYAFMTPIATVQNAVELSDQYNFALNWGLDDLSKVGFWMLNTSVNAFVTKSNSIFVISVGWFPMAVGSPEQCKIFQTTYPLDLSQTPGPRLALASNVVTYYRGNALTHYFSDDRTINVATAPITSAGLDALGYTPGRVGVDLRLTTKIPILNTSNPQVLDVTFYKVYPKSICTGCSTVTELGFGHCNMTFVYNHTTKSVKITKSNNVLGATYKFGLLMPQSLFSSASHYVKVIAIVFAVGGFLASRRTVMWLEVDHTKSQTIAAKIIRMVLPKYFPYPSHALRFDMFCYNSDIFVFLFTASVVLDMQNSLFFLRAMNSYNTPSPSALHYLQMYGLTTRMLWLNCTCLKILKILWSVISTASYNGESKLMGFFNLSSVTSLYLSAIMLIEIPAYIEYNNSLNYDLNNKVENLDAIHVTSFDSFYMRAAPAVAGLIFTNVIVITTLDRLWNWKSWQMLNKNSLARQAIYNSSSILCDFLFGIEPDTDSSLDNKGTILICKARRLSTLQWFFMSHLTCFGLPEKELRARKRQLQGSATAAPTATTTTGKEDGSNSKCLVVQDGDRNVHLLDGQLVEMTSLVYNIKVLKDTNVVIQ